MEIETRVIMPMDSSDRPFVPDTLSFDSFGVGTTRWISADPSDEWIEAAARRAYEVPRLSGFPSRPWELLEEERRNFWLAVARAVLA
jgi:hypothetical protein